MKLYLTHGRASPNQDLATWGDEGPTLDHVLGVHVVYMGMLRVRFDSLAAMQHAMTLTGWTAWDTQAATLAAPTVGDLVHAPATGLYFGDWGLLQ